MFIYFTGHTKRLCKWLLFIPKVSKGTAITGKQNQENARWKRQRQCQPSSSISFLTVLCFFLFLTSFQLFSYSSILIPGNF